jgi:hypothetical protein
MDIHSPSAARHDPASAAARHQRQRRREMLITTLAVGAVAVASLLAVFAPPRGERAETRQASSVVTAPPLVAASRQPETRAMGSAPACPNCGVVENVVAVHGRAQGKTAAVGFLMNIRMDDGTTRMVEQRGALAAGSRVVVERDSVRALMPNS